MQVRFLAVEGGLQHATFRPFVHENLAYARHPFVFAQTMVPENISLE